MLVRDAVIPAEVPIVRELFEEYGASLGFDLCFQGFAEELATLPGRYAPPAGGIWLAVAETETGQQTGGVSATGGVGASGGVLGCIALRPLDVGVGERVAEIKRLYVRPAARGTGAGRRLAERAVAAAEAHGYERIVLDTLATMIAAMSLYRSLGFEETGAYYPNPLPGVVYFARRCGVSPGSAQPPRHENADRPSE